MNINWCFKDEVEHKSGFLSKKKYCDTVNLPAIIVIESCLLDVQ